MFYISDNGNDLIGLEEIYGLESIGLVDVSGVYTTYRTPNPTAPYPQDYIIDKQGRVRFWETEFEAQESIEMIEKLLQESAEPALQDGLSQTKGRAYPLRSNGR